jgi:hypothetical protein
VRAIVTELLRRPVASVEQVAEVINRVLRRNEEARIYHGQAATGSFPPRRPRPERPRSRYRRE